MPECCVDEATPWGTICISTKLCCASAKRVTGGVPLPRADTIALERDADLIQLATGRRDTPPRGLAATE